MATLPATSGAPALRSLWMVSARFDLAFFVGSALLVLPAWYAVEHLDVPSFYLLAVVAVMANAPHLMSTWTRVYLDGHERTRRPFDYYVVPAAIAAFVVVVILLEGRRSSTLRTILLYWAFWHFLSQNWGILRLYQRKAGEVASPVARLERAVLYLGAFWPLLTRLRTGPWELFRSYVYHPTIPAWLTTALLVALAVAVVALLVVRVAQVLRGGAVDLIRPLFLASSFLGFFVPFVLMTRTGRGAFAAAACWHGIQYIGIVWLYNRNRWSSGVDPRARFISWLSQPGRAWLYGATLLAMAGVVYGLILLFGRLFWDAKVLGALTWLALTFAHYWLDGLIWKLRRPELRRNLGAA